jgi:Arc/MetJ-type ribon-helix-helix transcriptional regulator
MAQRCVRLSESVEIEVLNAVRSDGYASSTAFLRTAVKNELKRRRGGNSQVERDIAATLEQHRRELKSMATALNAQFALIDAFTRAMLHCIPEPSAEIHQAAKAQAKERHQRVLRMASANMKGESQAAMAQLAGQGNDY